MVCFFFSLIGRLVMSLLTSLSRTCFGIVLALLGALGPRSALGGAETFQVGIYADDFREVTCVTGQAGQAFAEIVWVWVPPDRELAYLTLRFRNEGNLDLSARPEWHPDITQVIITEYPENTVEWNMVFAGCPAGWVRVFARTCVLLDDQPGQLAILPEHSLARDCAFQLNPVQDLNDLLLNDPDCAFVGSQTRSWSAMKSLYLQRIGEPSSK